jgi:uroporphyrin-III C-methyltransferase
MPADLPVMAINNGTTPDERRLVSRLDRVADAAAAEGFSGPVLFVIGRVVSLYEERPAALLARLAAAPREAVHA